MQNVLQFMHPLFVRVLEIKNLSHTWSRDYS